MKLQVSYLFYTCPLNKMQCLVEICWENLFYNHAQKIPLVTIGRWSLYNIPSKEPIHSRK